MLEPTDGGFSPENLATLDRLIRSVDLAEGFALFFARCNIPVLRRQLIDAATNRLASLGVSVIEIAFEEEIINLRTRLRGALLANRGDAVAALVELPMASELAAVAEPATTYAVDRKQTLFVTGLENSISYSQPNTRLLAELNLGRDLFRRDAPHPLVLWLPDYALTAVARYAPDF